MAEKSKPETAPQKRTLKLSPALGDWTSYKPARSLVKKIKIGLYGFDRLSDEELEETHLLHYRFGETLLKTLKINLKFGGELFSIEALQSTYGSFQKSVAGPLVQGRIEVPEFHEEITFCFEMDLINTVVNSSLGFKNTSGHPNDLTEAEKIVINTAFSNFLAESLNTTFRDSLRGTGFELVGAPDLVANPYTAVSSTFVYFILEISFGETVGKIILGYSGNLIKSLVKKMRSRELPRPLMLNKIKSNILNQTKIPVSVALGTTELTGSEIYQLEVGDVVSLDNSIHKAIHITLAENGITILAQPGVKDGKLIVRVVGIEREKEVRVAPPISDAPPPPPPEEETAQTAEMEVPFEKPAEEFTEETPPAAETAEFQAADDEEIPITEEDLEDENFNFEETPEDQPKEGI